MLSQIGISEEVTILARLVESGDNPASLNFDYVREAIRNPERHDLIIDLPFQSSLLLTKRKMEEVRQVLLGWVHIANILVK